MATADRARAGCNAALICDVMFASHRDPPGGAPRRPQLAASSHAHIDLGTNRRPRRDSSVATRSSIRRVISSTSSSHSLELNADAGAACWCVAGAAGASMTSERRTMPAPPTRLMIAEPATDEASGDAPAGLCGSASVDSRRSTRFSAEPTALGGGGGGAAEASPGALAEASPGVPAVTDVPVGFRWAPTRNEPRGGAGRAELSSAVVAG